MPNLRHIEYFHDHQRIERMLFDGALDPCGGMLRPDPGRPGLGLDLRTADAERFRRGRWLRQGRMSRAATGRRVEIPYGAKLWRCSRSRHAG